MACKCSVHHCIVTANAPHGEGGGIFNALTGTLTVTTSEVRSRTPIIHTSTLYPHLLLHHTSSSQVHDNTANKNGGGIYNCGTLTLIGSQIHKNTASLAQGGGIGNEGNLTITNGSSIDNNGAQGEGGGIYAGSNGGGVPNAYLTITDSEV